MKRFLAALAVLALLSAPAAAQSKLDQAITKAYEQLQKGKPEEAVKTLTKAAAEAGPEGYLALGRLQERIGDLDAGGSIMAAYIAFGVEAKHLLAAVIMTAPGTILLAKMLVPETGEPETAGTVKLDSQRPDANVIGAAARGTTEGLHLALNVAGMLILASTVVHAFLAAPTPLRVFLTSPPNVFVAHFPFIWLPGFLVPVAFALHLLSLRQSCRGAA